MARKKPFIISYELEELSSGLPFVIEHIHSKEEQHPLMEAHRHGYYAIGICIEGESSHMLDFEKVVLRAREIIMIVPGQIHHPINVHEGTGWLIAFTTEFIATQSVRLPLAATDKIQLSADDFAQVVTIIQQMERENKEQAPHYATVLQHYLSVLITLLQRNTIITGSQSAPSLLCRFRELLATHFREWTKPAQYAGALHISPDHLNEVIKQHTGQTATAMITERRILEAKRLLLHAKESIKEIAWHLQFNEISYFNKFFKQHTGYTPASFREALREKYLFIPE
jgi:AraC-like DNA-binding protein